MFREVMWINTAAVLPQAIRIVLPVIPVNGTMIVVSINPMVIWMNMVAVLQPAIPGVPPAINVSDRGKLNALYQVCPVVMSTSGAADLPRVTLTVRILDNVNVRVIVKMDYCARRCMNQSRVVGMISPTCVKPNVKATIHNNVPVPIPTILRLVATFMNQ
mmetsp:Transcript_31788/g.35677  ORF Transcript_31788/g.35677 Transcript_31788/m.35677 type:complete len:160 (-) Transcript_31788:981-1460(-)